MSSNDHKMITPEREQRILDLLHQATVLTVPQLARELAVSEATIRRYIAAQKGM